MDFLTCCSGCKHVMTLPERYLGRPVECPNCAREFDAIPTAANSTKAEPTTPPGPLREGKDEGEKPPTQVPALPIQTAYTPRERSPKTRVMLYCILCGTRIAAGDEKCPNCGCPIQTPQQEDPPRRSLRSSSLQSVRGLFAIVGAILIPLGIVFFIGAPIADEFLRRNPMRDLIPILLVFIGILVELVALIFCMAWLYQAWRAISHEDDEYSPALMVGLLLIPFFNFYWMFRAIPGLSKAIHRESRRLAPAKSSSAGWVAGVAACLFALIPYAQPIAVFVFIAWMLIANSAIQRLARLHELWLDDEEDVEFDNSRDRPRR